jgi:plastocyanin
MKATGPVKEFTTTAYYDETGVWYSLKEIRVKKGDTVRVMATNTKGMHDFVIDEFSVKKELPMNEAVTIEFTADKTGEFIYYCSKPGHRDKGQWGKLIVE